MKQVFTGKRKRRGDISDKVLGMFKILRLIEQGRYPSVQDLVDELEVSRRTVLRYLKTLDYVVPITYDRQRRGYCLTNPQTRKILPLRTEELATLAVFYDLASHAKGPLKKYFENILRMFQVCVNSPVKEFPELTKTFHIVMPAMEEYKDEALLGNIIRAIFNRKRIFIRYHGLTTKERTTRKVDPYALVLHEGFLYLYGFCHKRRAFRWFALDRIESLVVMEETFFRDEGFDIEEELRQSWQMYQGAGQVMVKMRFSKEVSHLVLRRRYWHPSEKRKVLPDGQVELTFYVDGTEEIKGWIYSWLPYVEVLEPEGLREEVFQELKEALTRHNRKSGR